MTATTDETPGTKSKPLAKIAVLAAVVLALFLASRFLPVEAWLKNFNQWIADLGAVGFVVFMFAYAAFQNMSSKFNTALDLPAQGLCQLDSL